MRKTIKKAIAFVLCGAILVCSGAAAVHAETRTDCGGKCEHSPVIVLPGINHWHTYLYDENDQPVMYNGSQIGSTLLILNEAALSTQAIVKTV